MQKQHSLTAEDFGYYSRVEMTLVLALYVLQEKGNYRYASIRALSAFFGEKGNNMHSVVKRAESNGLVQSVAAPSLRSTSRAYVKAVSLTAKGAQLVPNSIQRIVSTQ